MGVSSSGSRPPCLRSPGRWSPGAREVACLIALAASTASLSGQAESDGEFAWHGSFDEAAAAALARDGGLLVYFPPADPRDRGLSTDRPPPWTQAAFPLEGLRVRAAEVSVLLARFGVSEVPALVVVDRDGTVALRAQGSVQPRSIAAAREALRRLAEDDGNARRSVAEAARLLERRDRRLAWRRIEAVVNDARAPRSVVLRARELGSVLEGEERRELATLVAREGRSSDAQLMEVLESSRKGWAHPATLAALDVELEVLGSLKPAGR